MNDTTSLVIKIENAEMIKALQDEIKRAVCEAMRDETFNAEMRNKIIDSAIFKLTDWENQRYALDEIIKKYIFNVALPYFIASDSELANRIASERTVYAQDRPHGNLPDETKIGIFFEHVVRKMVREELASVDITVKRKRNASRPSRSNDGDNNG
jgi:hypothetical protein